MDRELRDKWIAALRSGEYTQGRGELKAIQHDPNYVTPPQVTHCCLGVLCAVAGVDMPMVSLYASNKERCEFGGANGTFQYSRRNPPLTGREQSELISMNDEQAASFETIAQWIEENL